MQTFRQSFFEKTIIPPDFFLNFFLCFANFLNVCGIKSKLLNPDFDLLIKSYDVLIFTETKTDNIFVITREK
jgi:hypothetical protein